MFAKYATHAEAEAVVKKIMETKMENQGEKVYAKLDLPLEVRVGRSVLYCSKEVLIEGGWDKAALWTDTEKCHLWCGDEVVLTTCVKEGKIETTFADGWRDYFKGVQKWEETLTTASKKLSDSKTPTKGLGKGKNKATSVSATSSR